MNLHTRLTDLLVTGGSHVSHAILLDRSRPSKHFWACARIGLWRGVRDRFSTVSTTVHHTLNAVARVKSVIMLQHDHRLRSLCNRIYYGARTHVPLDAQRLLRFACGLHGVTETTRVRDPVKTAMEKEQTRERERYTRTIASRRVRRAQKSFRRTPYCYRYDTPQYVHEIASSDLDLI